MASAQEDMGIKHHFSRGLYAKEMLIPKDCFVVQHRHEYDHLSVLAYGAVVVEVDGESTVYVAPTCINIKAGAHHKIAAVQDSVWYCIHATDETDTEEVDSVLIQRDS